MKRSHITMKRSHITMKRSHIKRETAQARAYSQAVITEGVRTIWLRHDLQTFQQRLKALSAKVAQEGIILTEDQVRAPGEGEAGKGSPR